MKDAGVRVEKARVRVEAPCFFLKPQQPHLATKKEENLITALRSITHMRYTHTHTPNYECS
jgi:hypothetical protein